MEQKKKKVYVSGPMTGLARNVYMARFRNASRWLRGLGYEVCNPTQTLICRWPWLYRLVGYRLTLKYDLWLLRRCTHIYMMPGWEDSQGACIECGEAFDAGVAWIPSSEKEKIDGKMKRLIEKIENNELNY